MNICIYGASSPNLEASYTEAGRELGRLMARGGHRLVFGGGCTGLMGAVVEALTEEGGYSIGIAPRFFDDKEKAVLYSGCSEFIWTETMRERKQAMEEHSDAFVMTPGGIGTLEEFFEILTSKQLGLHNKPIAVLNTNGIYDDLVRQLVRYRNEKFMNPVCLEIFRVCDTPAEVMAYLENYDPDRIDIAHIKYI